MPERSEKRAEFYQFMLDDSFSAVLYWMGEEPDFDLDKVTTDDIARGWQALLELERADKFQHCLGHDRSVRDAERALTNEAYHGQEDYDACVIDAAIQLAMFGEIRYS